MKHAISFFQANPTVHFIISPWMPRVHTAAAVLEEAEDSVARMVKTARPGGAVGQPRRRDMHFGSQTMRFTKSA